MNQYFDDKIIINHYDLYRIKNKEECYEIGIFDNLNKSINLIEWPEIVENEIKKLSINIIKIQIKVDKNNNRLITF